MYDGIDLKLEELIGKEIVSAFINKQKDIVLLITKQGPLYLSWTGDCCSKCFLANISGSDILIGSIILEVKNIEWTLTPESAEEDSVVETMGTILITNKGHITLESRLEHNGYYGGQIKVSNKAPIDQYNSYLSEDEFSENDFERLKDY